MIRIAKLHAQQRAGTIKLIVVQPLQNIRDRQPETLDGHQRSVIKCDERPAGAHENPQSLSPRLS